MFSRGLSLYALLLILAGLLSYPISVAFHCLANGLAHQIAEVLK